MGAFGAARRILFAGLTASLFAAVVATVTLSPSRTAHDAAPARHGFQSLPASARGPIAAALGRADPAYRIRGLSAVNVAQRLHTNFTPRGVSVASGGGRLGLSLSAFGRAGALEAPGPVLPRVSANRVSYEHGALREWYANGPLGLEQGFDLARKPGGASGPATLALGLSGDLSARLDRGSVVFSGVGARLRYMGLSASDARGRSLRAWLELARRRILVRLDDRGARYPVHVDPFIQQAELTASDGAAGDELGYSVAVSGDTVVAGAPYRNGNLGAAYVFTRPSSGWANATQTAELTASDGVAGDFLGYSVGVSGDTIVVGAPRRNSNEGTAYVFVKPAGGWANATQTAELTASDAAPSSVPSDSVAVSGNTIVVGVPGKNSAQGAAYVYVMPAGGWVNATQTAELTASDGAANDELGGSVAVFGGTVVAGAAFRNGSRGAAYVFVMPPAGWPATATQAAELTASDGAGGDFFGSSVGVSGTTIVAGADGHTVGANSHQGAAYVFVEPSGGWATATQTAELTASDGAANDFFGYPVAVSGNTIVTGAEGRSSERGAAYVFVMPGGGWSSGTQTGELIASDGKVFDGFGSQVGISGDTIVASAIYRTVGANNDQGTLYVFTRPGPSVSITSPHNGAVYGQGQVVHAAFGCSDAADGPGLAGCAGTASNGSPINTTPGTHIFTAAATDNAGQQSSQSVTYTVLAIPVLARAHQTHNRWRGGSKLAHFSRRRKPKPPVGTTFSFALNEQARVTFTFTQQLPGRKVRGKCVAPTKHNRHKPACKRIVTPGTLAFTGHPGTNKVFFDGRLSRSKRLKPGRYTLTITATNAVGQHSRSQKLTFTIVK
jgi:hypothetical protein